MSIIEKLGERLFYTIFFVFIVTDSIGALIGAWTGDTTMILKGIRGIGFQILVLMGYLYFTGQLFNKKE